MLQATTTKSSNWAIRQVFLRRKPLVYKAIKVWKFSYSDINSSKIPQATLTLYYLQSKLRNQRTRWLLATKSLCTDGTKGYHHTEMWYHKLKHVTVKWPKGKVIVVLRGIFAISSILNPESQLTINIEHHLPHGRPNRLMESKPDLPTPPQGVIVAFRSWEEGAAHRGVPREKDNHTVMLLLSK